jgi:hypothetical protein
MVAAQIQSGLRRKTFMFFGGHIEPIELGGLYTRWIGESSGRLAASRPNHKSPLTNYNWNNVPPARLSHQFFEHRSPDVGF